MIRFLAVTGFMLMFVYIRESGNLNKYINLKYSYLSTIAIVLFGIFSVIEFIRFYRTETEREKRKEALKAQENGEQADHQHVHVHEHEHEHEHAHSHEHHHDHSHDHGHDHTHESKSKWKRAVGRLILFVPVFTGILLPVQTFDASFVKAKGFSFLQGEFADGSDQHQFLKPDTSKFFGEDDYDKLKSKEYGEFQNLQTINLTDDNYLKGIEVLYNYPGSFMNKTVSFEGFIFKGEQSDANHYFVLRFGMIHCIADSGVFGMLVKFPDGTVRSDNQWVKVTGTLTSEMYGPFEQVIPVLKVSQSESIQQPSDPYVYRNF